MTREEAKELLPIIQAFADGKVIEAFAFDTEEWKEIDNPTFSLLPKYYRIKPESKYRPFKTQKECWNEMLKHQPFGYIKKTKNNSIVQITGMNTASYGELHIDLSVNQHSFYTADCLFEIYVFADDTPFGTNK